AFLGAVLCVYSAWLLWLCRRSRAWLSTTGTIIETNVERSQGVGGTASQNFHLRLLYEYQADGQTLEGRRVSFDDSFQGWFRREFMNVLAGQYPPGREVTVYYDPRKPSRCTLNRKGSEHY